MIQEDYVSYEVAKLLKEKGFDIECNTAYYNGSLIDYTMYGFCIDGEFIFAPTHQMTMKWLREIYGLHIWVDYSRLDCNEKQPYLWNIVETKIDGDYWGGTYNKSPKNAVESALNYTLKNLI